jgi:hypothetical protein
MDSSEFMANSPCCSNGTLSLLIQHTRAMKVHSSTVFVKRERDQNSFKE